MCLTVRKLRIFIGIDLAKGKRSHRVCCHLSTIESSSCHSTILNVSFLVFELYSTGFTHNQKALLRLPSHRKQIELDFGLVVFVLNKPTHSHQRLSLRSTDYTSQITKGTKKKYISNKKNVLFLPDEKNRMTRLNLFIKFSFFCCWSA